MSSIDAAITVLKSQDPPKYSQVAREFNVDLNTLMRRFKGTHQSRTEYHENHDSLLNKGQQQYLVHYINKLTDRGIPPTHRMVRNFAHNIAKKEPGKNWSLRFVQKYSKVLDSGYLKAFEMARKKADNCY